MDRLTIDSTAQEVFRSVLRGHRIDSRYGSLDESRWVLLNLQVIDLIFHPIAFTLDKHCFGVMQKPVE